MALVLNEDQQLLKDSAQSFCQQLAPVSLLRRLRDSKDETGFDRDVWKQMVDLGWAGMAIPEAYGGYGFGYGGLGVVLEETGRTLVSSPLISTVLLAATAINELGSEEQKQELLPKIVAGELLVALALDENSSHAPSRIGTKAEKSGDGFILSGAKTFVLDGHVAQKLIVVARSSGEIDSRQGLSLFLVDANAPGVERVPHRTVDGRQGAEIRFNQVKVAEAARIGALHGGYAIARQVLHEGLLALSAESVGSLSVLLNETVEYSKTRKQFGVPIGKFQGRSREG